MILFKRADDLSRYLSNKQREGKSVGFVPTMGALHRGHLTLLAQSKTHADLSVVSIFVNPTQFNDPSDFQKYPVTIESDMQHLLEYGADILFLPSLNEIYPAGSLKPITYELGNLEQILEGEFRPGHFQGVAQVMDRLLTIAKPEKLFMGRKDYQQCMVVQKLIDLKNFTTQLIIVDTVREKDGLAMSSRNMRLTSTERALAPSISEALLTLKKDMKPGDLRPSLHRAKASLTNLGFSVDYFELADAKTLNPMYEWDGRQPLVAIVAAFLNEVRLIDNMPV